MDSTSLFSAVLKVRMPESELTELKRLARARNEPLSVIVREALRDMMNDGRSPRRRR